MNEQRRLAAILAADMVGYSRLIEADESGTIARQKTHRAQLIDPKINEYKGRIVKTTGDGLLVEFASVVDAVKCAVDIQTAMTEREDDVSNDLRIQYRIGINIGDVVVDGDDIFGDGVNVAARIEGLCQPGEVYISGAVHDQVLGKLELSFEDLGTYEVKNISRQIHVFRIISGVPGSVLPKSIQASGAYLTSNKPSIAVLPFTNMSGDPDQEYFTDGMVEEIITGLSRIHWLAVIARNSTFAYKGQSPDIRQVGRELSVRYVIEGSVRKAGNRVRITAQLIEAETGGHLWAESFDGTLEDVFDLQDQITAGVVAAIEPSVRQAEIDRAKRKRPDNLDAYDLYLRALEQSYAYTPEGRSTGLDLLDASIALEPNYAEAHGVAAYSLQQRYLWGGRDPADRAAALKHAEAVVAERTDDATALAFAALALSALDGRHDIALVMLDRALEQNPSSAIAHGVSALVNMILGRSEKAEFHAKSSLRLSPFDPLRHVTENTLAGAKLAAGQYKDALECVRRGLEANPNFAPGLTTLAICLVRLDRLEEARRTMHQIVEIAPDTSVDNLPERYLIADGLGIDRVIADLRLAGLPE